MFLKKSERLSPGFSRLDFSKTRVGPFQTAFYSENEPTDMLEATDHSSFDRISPFHGAVTDVMCRTDNDQEITNLATKCVELC